MDPWPTGGGRCLAWDAIGDANSHRASDPGVYSRRIKAFMSMTPNNPFDDQQGDQDFGQSPSSRKGGKGCLIGCAVGGFLAVFGCCGGTVATMYFTLSVLSEEYQRQLAGNPVIEEHIGDIESMEFSWTGTVEEAQNSGNQGAGAQIGFEIKGSKGSGRVLIEQGQGGGGNMIKSGTLILPDGTRIPIDVSAAPGETVLPDNFDPLIATGEVDSGDDAAVEPADAQQN
jgi:hypothetical protein